MPPARKGERIYELRVELLDNRPPIWRRFQVPGSIRLADLHIVLQIVMGWMDSHLHEFEISKKRYGNPHHAFDDPDIIDETRVRLDKVLTRVAQRMLYTYDFGDGWRHKITVKKIEPVESRSRRMACLAGKRNCPPEDVGGPWGYQEYLEAIADPAHERHQEMLDWMGEGFESEAFDLDSVNRMLSGLRV